MLLAVGNVSHEIVFSTIKPNQSKIAANDKNIFQIPKMNG